MDWRNNLYERFLLRREILHHLEATSFYEADWNVYSYASRGEISAEVDRLFDDCPAKYERKAFSHVLVLLPWELALKHGRLRYSRLTEVLAKTE